ncbi:MAG: HAD-IIIA family hydrolase [Pseudomonadota bacterium]
MKAIILDKEGTLVDEAAGPRRFTLRSGAAAALRLLAMLDYRFVVVSDQAPIWIRPDGADVMAAVAHRLGDLLFRERLTLEGFYHCTHDPEGSSTRCLCRKPRPGMLLTAATELGIDLRGSWMVGATLHDVEAGNRAGCRTLLVDNGHEKEWRLGPRRVPTRIAPDLYAAAVMIAGEGELR